MPSKTDINPATGKMYAVNPATGNWDDNYWANVVEPQLRQQYGQSTGGGGGGGGGVSPSVDPIALAGSLQQMQVQANQPAIQTLQTQQTNLGNAYSDLLGKIMQSGSVAANTTIGVTNAELARRGITGDSFLAGQTIGSALLPVTSQTQQAESQVGLGSAQDINQLASQIASLQQGNVPGAITATPQFAALSTLPSQIALTRAQAQAAPFVPISQGGFLFGPSGAGAGAGTLINPLLLALKQMGVNLTG